MSCGFARGFDKTVLLDYLKSDKELFSIAILLTDEEILKGKKPPILRKGDEIEVIVNAKNLTYHRGTICELLWNVNEKEWFYHIFENGKRVGKRYYESDLVLLKKIANSYSTLGY